ncbi:MAG: hypothetical protein DRR08_15285 [Candidatus Parabeggiatoa sp. nov. 2]|nr:MAG: hypothetical protein DRR08_15285 [Gammaproteobacteria bacterium]
MVALTEKRYDMALRRNLGKAGNGATTPKGLNMKPGEGRGAGTISRSREGRRWELPTRHNTHLWL